MDQQTKRNIKLANEAIIRMIAIFDGISIEEAEKDFSQREQNGEDQEALNLFGMFLFDKVKELAPITRDVIATEKEIANNGNLAFKIHNALMNVLGYVHPREKDVMYNTILLTLEKHKNI